MTRRSSIQGVTVAGVAVALALGGGYWLGQSKRPSSVAAPPPAGSGHADHGTMAAADHQGQGGTTAGRTILYYQDPTGASDYSPVPKKNAEGRDYLPVYADAEAIAAAPAPAPAPPPGPSHAKGKILYYRNPMGLPDTSPVPKKDPMGMNYVPVYEGDEDDGSMVKISIEKVQKIGVRTEAATMRRLIHTVRAVGTVQVDERLEQLVVPKFDGYVEVLQVDTTGEEVRRGQTLMEIYSPNLVLAEQEYLAAWKALQALPTDAGAEAREAARMLADGALLRLRNWDIPGGEVEKLKRTGKVSRTLALPSLVNGVVLEKKVVMGQYFRPGDTLYRLADLSTVWVNAEVYEDELAYVQLGQEAKIRFDSLPDKTFSGKITFIYPVMSPGTRTVKVRIEMPNLEDELKPAMYGAVTIATAAQDKPVLAVPESALIDSGSRKVVLIERGEGRYEPRDVRTGLRTDGYVEILNGVSASDKVVVSANFLIDSESNLRAALQSFHHH